MFHHGSVVTISGVEEGNGGNAVPQIFLGDAVLPNDIRTRGNGDRVAFHQVSLQRSAKSAGS